MGGAKWLEGGTGLIFCVAWFKGQRVYILYIDGNKRVDRTFLSIRRM